jgi:hypothetical protein
MNPAHLIKGKHYLYFNKDVIYIEHTLNKRVFKNVANDEKHSLAESTVKSYIVDTP